MKAHFQYLKYVLRHKWYVFIECCRLGIPWLGIIHDLSKFSRAEWRPYVLSFYSGWEKDDRPQWIVRLFDRALQHHYDHNAHHPEHWHIGNGIFPISDYARREMLADWRGMARQRNSNTRQWYNNYKDKILLHEETKEWIEMVLERPYIL